MKQTSSVGGGLYQSVIRKFGVVVVCCDVYQLTQVIEILVEGLMLA